MVKQAGDDVYSGSTAVPAPWDYADGIDYGAAVAEDAGTLAEANSETHAALAGVKARGGYDNERGVLAMEGVWVAKVATGTAAGVDVDMGNATAGTVGVLEESAGGPGYTLCAEGGTYEGADIPAGHAVVRLR